jgi:tryptophan synthase alpha chain
MIAPTTPNQRIKKIILAAKKTASHNSQTLPTFLYLVSVTGVTGSHKTVSQETIDFIKRVKRTTDIALIVGFGISQSKHIIQIVSAGADGVVTCSPIVEIIHNQQKTPEKMFRAIGEYVRGLGIAYNIHSNRCSNKLKPDFFF